MVWILLDAAWLYNQLAGSKGLDVERRMVSYKKMAPMEF